MNTQNSKITVDPAALKYIQLLPTFSPYQYNDEPPTPVCKIGELNVPFGIIDVFLDTSS